MKICSIVGTRPQFIKLSPLCRAIAQECERHPEKQLASIIIHTGQHYDYAMSKSFFDQMLIPAPAFDLEVGSGTHGKQTGLMLEGIEQVLTRERPDIVVVFGDTNSTLAGAVAASKLHIPVAHAEAGLRSFNKEMPEEINRIVTDHVSTLLFCPTKKAMMNLRREGFENVLENEQNIDVRGVYLEGISTSNPLVIKSGDLMYDALLYNATIAEERSTILSALSLKAGNYGLLTIHRAENTGNVAAFQRLCVYLEKNEHDVQLVFPAHPRTEHFIKENHIVLPKNVRLIPPASYFDMMLLEKYASRIYTDSGGIQKEAYLFKIPCITLRKETEWSETVESGWNHLMGEKSPSIQSPGTLPPWDATLFGNGNAAQAHLRILMDFCQ